MHCCGFPLQLLMERFIPHSKLPFSLNLVTFSYFSSAYLKAKSMSKGLLPSETFICCCKRKRRRWKNKWGKDKSNRERLNIWNSANLLEVMWSQLMGDTRRQSPIMLAWGLLARLHLSWPWSLALLYKCVCVWAESETRRKREGETDYERWRKAEENKVTLLWLLA